MRKVLPYVILVVVVGLVLYAFREGEPIGAGKTAPDVILRMLEGGEQKALSSYQRRVVVLDFWATWCAPCRFTMPKLEEFYRRYKEAGVEVIGVAVDVESYDAVRQFVKEAGITYPIAMDTSGEAKQYYQIRNLPTLFVIDKDGIIQLRLEGYDPQNTEKQLEEAVRKALERPAKPLMTQR
jgi:peroxiredoxin